MRKVEREDFPKHTVSGEYWIVEKKIVLSVITFFIVQFSLVVWWAATTDAKVNENTRRINRLEKIVESMPEMKQDIKWICSYLESKGK